MLQDNSATQRHHRFRVCAILHALSPCGPKDNDANEVKCDSDYEVMGAYSNLIPLMNNAPPQKRIDT